MIIGLTALSRHSWVFNIRKAATLFTNMMSRSKSDKVLEQLQDNPFFRKYEKKIVELQQLNPDLFTQRIEEQESKIQAKKEKHEQEHKVYEGKAKESTSSGSYTKDACLSDIMNIDMIQDKSKEEIEQIWREYHKQKDYICAILEPEQYDKIFELGKKFPLFLLPLPRKECYEFFLSQFQGNKVYITSLLWYQTHHENAPECLTMTHYTELRESKNLILMRGDFDLNFLNAQEAQCLANELQLYYSGNNSNRLRLLEVFNKTPNDFSYKELIDQMEKISLTT